MKCPECGKEIDAYEVVKPPLCYSYLCEVERQEGTGCSTCSWNRCMEVKK